jgi:hypothetical protein
LAKWSSVTSADCLLKAGVERRRVGRGDSKSRVLAGERIIGIGRVLPRACCLRWVDSLVAGRQNFEDPATEVGQIIGLATGDEVPG